MGIVLKQSFNNLITTYLGFGIGALNTLVLYINFMREDYYGLVGFIVSTAMILMPLMSFGIHNTLVKFYSSYTNKDQDQFLTWMLLLPLFIILPSGLLCAFFYVQIGDFLSSKNEIVSNYIWYIFSIAAAAAYFEVFFAWSKVQFKTIFGNFMKEVFHRAGITILLIVLAYKIIDVHFFLKAMVVVYVLRMLIMSIYAFTLKAPRIMLSRKLPTNFSAVLKYTSLIIIAGSIATVLLDIDKVMIGKYVIIENIAYYSVAIYIATVIAVPARAMHQITYPMVAEMLNQKRYGDMKILYRKSSLTLFVVSSLLFLLIVCNLDSLYDMVKPSYRSGLYVVIFIGIAKLLDNCLGINNAILFNSDYYRLVLVLGVILVILAIVLNIIFIPMYGIHGAAIATFIASVAYAVLKMMVVKWKFEIQPFTSGSFKMFLLLILFFIGFYFWDFSFHPFINIILKSIIILLLYFICIYFLNISKDVTLAINKYIKS